MDFTLTTYKKLLLAFKSAEYTFRPMSSSCLSQPLEKLSFLDMMWT